MFFFQLCFIHSHKVPGSMGSRNGIEERDTLFVRGFYKLGTKMTPRFRDGDGIPGSRIAATDPVSCDYGFI
jgi:hypothetical protein